MRKAANAERASASRPQTRRSPPCTEPLSRGGMPPAGFQSASPPGLRRGGALLFLSSLRFDVRGPSPSSLPLPLSLGARAAASASHVSA